MRIDEVQAVAFGPLRRSTLSFAPGLNVFYGPNEAGKSSWFGATYAGLVGRRRARGRGTLAQAEFAARHKPWAGSQWSAGVAVTLDSGSRVELRHNLARGGSEVIDADSGRVIPVDRLEKHLGVELTSEGSLDGARILGLTRDSVRATIFVGQADVLRVLEDADELQEFLERATTTSAIDVTAESGLAWLEAQRRERVGVLHVGQRPLRMTRLELEDARGEASAARDELVALTDAVSRRRELQTMLSHVRKQLSDLDAAEQWLQIRRLRDRVERARSLTHLAVESDAVAAPAEEQQMTEAVKVLGAFEVRGEPPALPAGRPVEEIAAELSAVPEMPEGDLEPREEVQSAREDLLRALAALESHRESPPEEVAESVRSLGSGELRALADRLSAPRPDVDPQIEPRLAELRTRHEAALAEHAAVRQAHARAAEQDRETQEAYEARMAHFQEEMATFRQEQADFEDKLRAYEEQARAVTPTPQPPHEAVSMSSLWKILVGAGIALLLVGGVIAAATNLVLGLVVAMLGLGTAVAGGVLRSRAAATKAPAHAQAPPPAGLTRLPERPTPPRPPSPPEPPVRHAMPQLPDAPAPDPQIARLELQREAQQAAMQAHEERRRVDLEVVAHEGLPAEPAELLALARANDDREAAEERRRSYEERSTALQRQRDNAAKGLARLLGVAEPEEDAGIERLLDDYAWYVARCAERTSQAKVASRHSDIEAALRARHEANAAYERSSAEFDARGTAVTALAGRLGGPERAVEVSYPWLKEWVSEQEAARARHAEFQRTKGTLEELLEGKTLPELEHELQGAIAAAGPEPLEVPANLEPMRADAERRREGLHAQIAELNVQGTTRATMAAVAIERETQAEVRVLDVEELARCLDLATQQLQESKERAQANIAPALEYTMRPWLPRITGGRYLDLSIDPETMKIGVSEVSGAVRQAHLLSHGTTEQVYLLLRLALAQHLATTDEVAPMILDDITVQSDIERTLAVMELLHEISRDRQVVVFTQEQEIVDWAHAKLHSERDRFQAIALTS